MVVLFYIQPLPIFLLDRIGGVIGSVLTSASAVDRGFKLWSGQTKDYKIGICCFSLWALWTWIIIL